MRRERGIDLHFAAGKAFSLDFQGCETLLVHIFDFGAQLSQGIHKGSHGTETEAFAAGEHGLTAGRGGDKRAEKAQRGARLVGVNLLVGGCRAQIFRCLAQHLPQSGPDHGNVADLGSVATGAAVEQRPFGATGGKRLDHHAAVEHRLRQREVGDAILDKLFRGIYSIVHNSILTST